MLKKFFFAVCISSLLFTGCDDEDDMQNSDLQLNISGLENLGDDYAYEGWLIVDGSPVTTGVFSVDDSGEMSSNSFSVATEDLENATKFVLTIEPSPDSDPAPSATHLVAGDFTGSTADLTIGAPEALGHDFASATGQYGLATPSDGMDNNEKSGVWFLGSFPPSAGLSLPDAPTGWVYEGWAVINGQPVSTGTFTDAAAADDFDGFSGPMGVPPFPGEDFIVNAPQGLTFPTDLSGASVVISIEPSPDNSPAPFLLKPLSAAVPSDAEDHVVYDMNNIISSNAPTGTATR